MVVCDNGEEDQLIYVFLLLTLNRGNRILIEGILIVTK